MRESKMMGDSIHLVHMCIVFCCCKEERMIKHVGIMVMGWWSWRIRQLEHHESECAAI